MASLKNLFPCLVLMFLFLSFSDATEFPVGDRRSSWKIPSSPDLFNNWAEKTRFKIGDSLVLKYDPKADSVLEVTEGDYESCNKGKPLKSFRDGKTKIKLDRSGPFYFISGADGHCQKGQKLQVVVLSAKHSDINTSAPAPNSPFIMNNNNAPVPAPAPEVSSGHSFKVECLGALLALMLATALLV